MERCCLFLQVSTRDFEYADSARSLSDSEPFRTIWSANNRKRKKLKQIKKKKPLKLKSKVMALLSKKKQ
jgi:hypothetical protein